MKSSTLNVRGLEYHIQEWGDPSKPLIFLLHGWMDCGATFQFSAQHLENDYRLVAPDLRGFGNTEHANAYWFPDYLADLDVLLDHYSPNSPVNLAGHSMGGNISLLYAGVRPDRISKVLSLEGLGLRRTDSNETPEKYRSWMREALSGEPAKVYPNRTSLQYSVHKGNPSLSPEMVEMLADIWGKPVGDEGAMMLKHDHAHRYTNPVRYNLDDTFACWKEVTARVGIVMADASTYYQRFAKEGRIDEAIQLLNVREQDNFIVEDSGHMLHIEQPEATAQCLRTFFS